MTHGATLGGHAVQHAVARAGVDPGRSRGRADGLRQSRGRDRRSTSRARSRCAPGCRSPCRASPSTASARRGLQTIAMAAQRVIAGEGERLRRRWRREHLLRAGRDEPDTCSRPLAGGAQARRSTGTCCRPPRTWPGATASPRSAQDEYGVRSQQRAAAAQAAGRFDDEIVPMTVTMGVADKATGQLSSQRGDDRRRRGHPRRHHDRSRARHPRRGARAASSPPATPASSPTAPRPAW